MRVVLFALFATLIAVSQASFCTVYAEATNNTQPALMEAVITDVVNRVLADSTTQPWFTGVNNKGGTDFTTNTGAFNSLFSHLVAFFGGALGCNSTEFQTGGKYGPGVSSSNMQTVHSGFKKPVTKAAYEAFNIHIIDSMANFGVSLTDLAFVASVLDGFRGPKITGNVDTNQVCQNTDCYDAPFRVDANEIKTGVVKYVAPASLKVPVGGSVQFRNNGTTAHTPTEGTPCTAKSGGFTYSLASHGATGTTPKLNTVGAVSYFCSIHCAGGQTGVINVVASTGSSSTGSAASLSLAAFAAVASIVALLM